MTDKLPLSSLPKCYRLGDTCGHILHVRLEDFVTNTLYLTMLEFLTDNAPKYPSSAVSVFVNSVLFQNPIWDLGFQFMYAKQNYDKVYTQKKETTS